MKKKIVQYFFLKPLFFLNFCVCFNYCLYKILFRGLMRFSNINPCPFIALKFHGLNKNGWEGDCLSVKDEYKYFADPWILVI